MFRTNVGAHGRADDRARRRSCCVATAWSSGSPPTPRSQHYETWGPYGASKAALDHLVLTFGAETGLATYAVDPGDMRTPMQQDAFPGEDISDRPLPETRGAAAARAARATSGRGRYRAADVSRPEVASRMTTLTEHSRRPVHSARRVRRRGAAAEARGARARRRTPAGRATRTACSIAGSATSPTSSARRPRGGEQLRDRQRRDRRASSARGRPVVVHVGHPARHRHLGGGAAHRARRGRAGAGRGRRRDASASPSSR